MLCWGCRLTNMDAFPLDRCNLAFQLLMGSPIAEAKDLRARGEREVQKWLSHQSLVPWHRPLCLHLRSGPLTDSSKENYEKKLKASPFQS